MNRNAKTLLIISLIIGLILSASIHSDSDTTNSISPPTSFGSTTASEVEATLPGVSAEPTMEVHFIDVGQGDSTLIINGDHSMLIDAGPNDKGTFLQLYLKKNGVEKLDYLILTHTDADHIGGADVIITKFDIDTVFMAGIEKDNSTYQDVWAALNYKALSPAPPSLGNSYSLGDAFFTIIAPNQAYEDSNDHSLGLILQKEDTRFLFTGDATKQAENDILQNGLDISSDVYKVGHHGSSSSSSSEFLDTVAPDYAVISCSADNPYGHPHKEVLDKLFSRNIQIYRTDEQGSIIATSDGNTITWTSDSTSNSAITYVCNTNSMKFHLPDCSSVADMSDKNKLETTLTKEEIQEQGFVGCKICNP